MRSVEAAWEEHYRAAAAVNPLRGVRALLAYNSVVDKVRPVDDALLRQLPVPAAVPPLFAKAATTQEDLAEGLCYSISNGLALEVLCAPPVIAFLDGLESYEDRLGGQAATVGRLLADYGAARILVHPDRFDARLARLYRGGRAEVPLRRNGKVERIPAVDFAWDCDPEVHYILEYPKGLAFGGGPAPRANRFIAAPFTTIVFHPEWEAALPEVCRDTDAFFIAGLNHMGEAYDAPFQRVREHIRTAKAANPDLVVHVEITSVPDLRKRAAIVDQILPLADSVGLNETELADLAFVLGLPRWEEVRRDPGLQLEALHLLRALGVPRVHLHTLGYYVALSPNSMEGVRTSLLHAALVAAPRAHSGRNPPPEALSQGLQHPLSPRGLQALEGLAESLSLPKRSAALLLRHGWSEEEGVVAIPTRLVPRPQYTVGLGDVISGAAFFGERWGDPAPQG